MKLIEYKELHARFVDFRNRFYAKLRKLDWNKVPMEEQLDIAKDMIDIARSLGELQERIKEIEAELLKQM